MGQHYSNPKRANDAHALPDIETFYISQKAIDAGEWDYLAAFPGWYWWSCFPGCMPDGEANGPFDSEEAALADARNGEEDEDEAPIVAPVERRAFQFFLNNAGYSTPPGRAVCALHLARAERDADDAGILFVWEDDDSPDLSWLDGKDERGRFLFPKSYREDEHEVLCCRAVMPCPEHGVNCKHAETLASLCGITDADAAYRRVVQAELAQESSDRINELLSHND